VKRSVIGSAADGVPFPYFGLILPMARDTTIPTSSRSAYGSHYYAAPEQASDFRNTPEQADIFAFENFGGVGR
jgi:hypothetical protein